MSKRGAKPKERISIVPILAIIENYLPISAKSCIFAV